MEIIGFTLLVIVGICILVATALSAFFIWIGSKFTGVRSATFGRAFYAAILSSVVVWALTGLATALFGIGSVAGWILGIVVTLWIFKSVYDTDWGSAVMIWIFSGIAQIIVGIIVVFLVVTGAVALAL
ncbi:MAG: hypothetical protein JW807_09160 [Spirochaetes bacterium]|nr:hypothetical protein [Spirochaetota bacterium]